MRIKSGFKTSMRYDKLKDSAYMSPARPFVCHICQVIPYRACLKMQKEMWKHLILRCEQLTRYGLIR